MNLDDCTFNWSILIASLSLLISVFVLLLNFIRYRRDNLIKSLIKCKHEIERFDQTGIRNGLNKYTCTIINRRNTKMNIKSIIFLEDGKALISQPLITRPMKGQIEEIPSMHSIERRFYSDVKHNLLTIQIKDTLGRTYKSKKFKF